MNAQYLAFRRTFERTKSSNAHEAVINETVIKEFDDCWKDFDSQMKLIPGKEAISKINAHLQDQYGISITPTAIIDAMRVDEIPNDIKRLIDDIARFALS